MMTSTMISGLFSDDVDHDDDGQVMDKRLFSNPLYMRWIMLMMMWGVGSPFGNRRPGPSRNQGARIQSCSRSARMFFDPSFTKQKKTNI